MVVSPLDSRYKTPISSLFDEKNRFKMRVRVEVAVAKALASAGIIPTSAAEDIEQAAERCSFERALEIEAKTHHDIMAVVDALAECCRSDGAKYVHYGLTSYDVDDCVWGMVLRDACDFIEGRLVVLIRALIQRADQTKGVICIGRTHGQHAIPTTYGMKFALFISSFIRHLDRLREARKQIAVGKIRGPVGTRASLYPKGAVVESETLKLLGLNPVDVCNQVIQRDRHAQVLFTLSLIACEIEKFAKEVRNLQRTEIGEVLEMFEKGQVGSSAMPQKRNPHKSERLCSLARVVRANIQTALENISLEHERDLTNSANERIIIPESFILTDFMLLEMIKIVNSMKIDERAALRNLRLSQGMVLSEPVMLLLVKKRVMGRQEAHRFVQQCAFKSMETNQPFLDVVKKTEEGKVLAADLEHLDERSYVGDAAEIVETTIKKAEKVLKTMNDGA